MSGPRVVVVVGASSGIGRAVAHVLAGAGDQLVLASRSEAALAEVAAECTVRAGASSPAPMTFACDIADHAAVNRLVAATTEHFGRLDVVVNTVAVVAYGRLVDIPADVFDRVLDVNLHGTANVARAALAVFEEQGAGHLVLVGSLLGKITTPWMGSYVTSKWGVHGLARTLQQETRRTRGVHVSLVSPGAVNTPVYAQAASYAGRTGRPPPPVARPETVAKAVARVTHHPRREVSVGLGNAATVTAFRTVPGLYDALVVPMMAHLGLSRRRVGHTTGNVWHPVAGGEAVHGRWGRHWLRGVALGAAAATALAVAGSRRSSSPQR